MSTPGGTRTRSFRIESPASSPVRPRGQEGSGGRIRTCASRVTVARLYQLDHAGTKAEAAGLEPARRRTARRHSTALALPKSAMPPRAEGEGVEPPRPKGPPVFETGYRAGGSPSNGPGRRRTCTVPGKNRELCRVELQGLDVTGRDRTCDAPRFRRALYRLSYGHSKWAEPESNRRPPPHQRGALPSELSA